MRRWLMRVTGIVLVLALVLPGAAASGPAPDGVFPAVSGARGAPSGAEARALNTSKTGAAAAASEAGMSTGAASTTGLQNAGVFAGELEVTGHAGGTSHAVAVRDGFAYVGFGQSIMILDISDPANPQPVANQPIPEVAYDIEVLGQTAYVAADALYIVDVSDPYDPELIGALDVTGWALGLYVEGDYAYLAEDSTYTGYLMIVDVSTPTDPWLVGSITTSEDAEDVHVVGDVAYVAHGYGMTIFDVSDRENPVKITTVKLGSYGANDVYVMGIHAYLSVSASGLWIMDISDPENPVRVGSCDGASQELDVSGSYVYAADAYDGLRVIDVSEPTNPTVVGTYDTPGFARNVYYYGSHAYVADDREGLRVVDVSTPSSPFEVSYLDTWYGDDDVSISGGYAYVASHYEGLQIIDVSDELLPTWVSEFDTSAFDSYQISVDPPYAYMTDSDNLLRIINVSSPAAPWQEGEAMLPSRGYDVSVSSGYAYVALRSGGLWVFDVRDPGNPSLVFQDAPYSVYGVYLSEPYAFLAAGDDGLRVLDVSDLDAPVEIGFYEMDDCSTVDVEGPYAYVGRDYVSHIFDVSVPTDPQPIAQLWGENVSVDGSLALTTAGYDYELRAYDVSNPSAPVEIGYLESDLQFSAPFVDSGLLYALQTGGLRILGQGGADGVDLSIDSVEPVQSVESQDLVKDKATAVKVVIRKSGDQAVDDVSVRLDYLGSSWTTFYVAEESNMNGQHMLVYDSAHYPLDFEYGETSKTVYFFSEAFTPEGDSFLASATVDYLDAVAETNELNNETSSSLVPAYDTRWSGQLYPDLYLHYFRTDWDRPFSEFHDHVDYSSAFLGGVLPVSEERFTPGYSLFFAGDTHPFRNWDNKLNQVELAAWVLKTLAEIRVVHPTADRFVSVVPEGWFAANTTGALAGAIGITYMSGRSPLVIAEARTSLSPNGAHVEAHETGHSYGLARDCEEYEGCNPTRRDGIGNYAAPGIWVDKRLPIDPSSRDVYCFMGATSGLLEYWIDAEDYATLLENHQAQRAASPAVGNLSSEAILATGLFNITGTLTLDDWYTLPEAELDILEPGPYTFEYLDTNGGLLHQVPFTVSFQIDVGAPIDDPAVNWAPFALTIPAIPGVAQIQVKHDDSLLGAKEVSLHAPQVTMVAPNGGEHLSGSVTVEWTASDADGDAVTFILAMSRDAGVSWEPIVGGLAETTYLWDTSTLPAGSEYLLRVIATDGFNAAEDACDSPFAISPGIYLPLVLHRK